MKHNNTVQCIEIFLSFKCNELLLVNLRILAYPTIFPKLADLKESSEQPVSQMAPFVASFDNTHAGSAT